MDVTVPGSSAGEKGNETTEPPHATAIAVAVPMHAQRATARAPLPALRPSTDRADGCNDEDEGRSAVGGEEAGRCVAGWRQPGLLRWPARSVTLGHVRGQQRGTYLQFYVGVRTNFSITQLFLTFYFSRNVLFYFAFSVCRAHDLMLVFCGCLWLVADGMSLCWD